ncbi:MAG: hypothetical protein ABIQ47_16325 [Tepidiformaceae bacterium]
MTSFARLARRFFVVAALTIPAAGATIALAQFEPPSTVFGSVTDAAGPVAADLPIQAYVGETLCGTKGKTEFTGDGAARVTVYAINVASAADKAGCGKDGADVRIKIGDRFAAQTSRWRAGAVQLDVTFGNATPAAIPTFTPTIAKPTPATTPVPGSSAAAAATSAAAGGTIPAGSPGAGSPVPTLKGGVTSSTPAAQRASTADDGGFPVWGIVLLVLLGVGAIGGGIGYAMSRSRTTGEIDSDDHLPPLE